MCSKDSEKKEKVVKKSKKPKKCFVCKKRNLTNAKCRCGKWTCLAHVNKHECNFDWQAHAREKLNDQLIKVEFSKVTSI